MKMIHRPLQLFFLIIADEFQFVDTDSPIITDTHTQSCLQKMSSWLKSLTRV